MTFDPREAGRKGGRISGQRRRGRRPSGKRTTPAKARSVYGQRKGAI